MTFALKFWAVAITLVCVLFAFMLGHLADKVEKLERALTSEQSNVVTL